MENFHDFLMRELKERGIQTATVLSVNKIVALRPSEVSEVIICMSEKDLENVDRISRAKWEEVFSEIGGKYYAQYGTKEKVDLQILSEIAIHNENFVAEGEHEVVFEGQILVPTMKTIYNKRIRRDEAFVAYLAKVIMFC